MKRTKSARWRRSRSFLRCLRLEGLEGRLLMANDVDDQISEAISLGSASTTPRTASGAISPSVDVDMYSLAVTAGQTIDFDIDTAENGGNGLGSYIRLFNAQGSQIAFNNDAAAPGENSVGFDAYLRVNFTQSGTVYLGVSNANNTAYNAVTGNGDTEGGQFAIGNYSITVRALPVDTDDSMSEAVDLGTISTTASTTNAEIDPDIDVDLYKFTVGNNQSVDFDIDTTLNGPGGLGSYLRLFNSAGTQIASNNDGVAPGESTLGFDAYFRYTFTNGGTYYLGVSNFTNDSYNPINGNGDTAGGQHSIGQYRLIVQIPAPPPNDTDDTIGEAVSLGSLTSNPIVRSGEISPDVDVDMFSFTVTSGQSVDFDIDTAANGPGGLGSFLRVFNSQGTELAFNDDANAPGENVIGFDAYLRHRFSQGGTYYVAVSNVNNTLYNPVTGTNDVAGGLHSTGAYQLTMRLLPVDNDDAVSEATALGNVSTTAISRSGRIDPDVDVDMYSFVATAGQVIDFDIDTTLNGIGGLGSYLRVFNSLGQQLAANDDGVAPGETALGFDAYLRHTFANAGTYYVAVSNNNNQTYNATTGNQDTAGGLHSIGDYTLVLSMPQPPINDNDDSISEARSLGSISTTAAVFNGDIAVDVDVDMYSFAVTSGMVVDFDIDTPTNGAGGLGSYLRVFNASGQELGSNNDALAPGENTLGFDAYLRLTFANAGTYYVAVSNANNTQYNPTTGGGDTAGGADAIGAYQLRVMALPIDSDDQTTEATAWGAITTNPKSTTAAIGTDIDVDVYSFSAVAGQTIDFDLDTTQNGVGGLGSYLRLFNSQGVQLAFNNDATAPDENSLGFDAYLRYTFSDAGTYFIAVSNANNTLYNVLTGNEDSSGGQHSIGDYTLVVQEITLPPEDTDDQISEAFAAGAASTTAIVRTGSISPDVDVDMVRFTVTAGQVVDFDIDTVLNGAGGLGSYLRLFNAQGQELAFNNDGSAPGEGAPGFDAYLRYSFTTAGTFYIAVSNVNNIAYNASTGTGDSAGGTHATGDYTLTIQALPIDNDDQLSEATVLGEITGTASTNSGEISPDIDVDMYRFTVTSGQMVDFDIDTATNGVGGLNSYLRVFDSNGQLVAANDNASASGEGVASFDSFLRVTFATGGTYYVGVSNFNNLAYNATSGDSDGAGGLHSIGDYTLIIQSAQSDTVDTDDTLAEATSLGTIRTTAATTSGAISPDVDVDIFQFTVSAGQIVDFDIDTQLNGSTGLNSYLRLFNSQGTQLAANNNATSPNETNLGLDAYLRYTFTSAGTYYIAVSNATNTQYDPVSGEADLAGGQNATGSYTLIVQALPEDLDDQLSEATSLGTISTTPNNFSATISQDVDVDLYRFIAVAGQVVDFDIDTSLNGGAGLESFLRLFNASGVQLAANDNAAAPGENATGFDAYLRYTFATAGTYYIGVSNARNTAYDAVTGYDDASSRVNATGSYQLIVQEFLTAPDDPDDTRLEAVAQGAVNPSTITINGSISPDTDVDMVKFTVTAGQTVDFDIDTTANGSGGLNSLIRLFDDNGGLLATSNNAVGPGENAIGFDAFLRYTFTSAGTYYLGVSNANNANYNPNTGTGDTAGGPDATGDYVLLIAEPVGVSDDLDDSIVEATNLGALSTTVKTTAGEISADVDVDVYSFTVNDGETIDFDIDTATNGGAGLGSYLRLFNAGGIQLATNDNAAAPGEGTLGLDSYLRYTFATGGTYYVAVSNSNNITYNVATGNGDTLGGNNATGAYQLGLIVVPGGSIDADDTIAEATPLGQITTNPLSRGGSIAPDVDVDMVAFTVSAGQLVDFDIDTTQNGATGLNSYLRLFDAQGQQLASNNNATSPGEGTLGFDAYLRYTFATAGTYYLSVSNATNINFDAVSGDGDVSGGTNSTGSYTLVITALPLDSDDTISEASSIGGVSTAGITVNATINPDIDVDVVGFTVTAGQAVDFNLDTDLNGAGGLNSYLRVFNAAGAQLAANNNAAGIGESTIGLDAYLRYVFSTAGTYYVAISNANNIGYDVLTGNGDTAGGTDTIGGYRLTIQAVTADPDDLDDTLAEATNAGAVSTTAKTITSGLDFASDVNMVSFTVTAGQRVHFDIDTTSNGGAGLQSLVRLFDGTGKQLALNDNATAPGEGQLGFDAYLSYTFADAGTYFIAVSNANNSTYDAVTGTGDATGGVNTEGAYNLIIQAASPDSTPSLTLQINETSIPELNGTATGTVTRVDSDQTVPLIVDITSSDTNSATVPTSVTIPAGQASVSFTITAVQDSTRGTRAVTITVSSLGFTDQSQTLQIKDSDGNSHNGDLPEDVSGDGTVSAIDVLLIINYLNLVGSGPAPGGNEPPFLDVSADGSVTPLDALLVINRINNPSGEGEGAGDAVGKLATNVAGANPPLMIDYATQESLSGKARSKWACAVDDFFAN